MDGLNQRTTSKNRRRLLTGFGLVFVAVTAFVSYKLFMRQERIAAGVADDRPSAKLQVRTLKVLPTAIPITYTVVGTVESVTTIDAASRVAARILAVKVHAGDRVKAGQVLVELDSADLRAQLAQAQAQLEAAQAEFVRAQADYHRFSALIKNGSVTQQEFDAAQAAYRSASGNLARARAGVEAAKAALSYAVVTAPIDGIVETKLVDPGDLALPGKPLVRLYDERSLRVSLEVPEQLSQRIALGMALTVKFDAPLEPVVTRINEIVPAADPSSRSFIVRAPLPPNRGLTPGMFARAELPLGQEKVLTVPAAAVRSVGQIPSVRVYTNGKVIVRQIAVGRTFGDRVEVLAGINPGDEIVVPETESQMPYGSSQ